MEIMIFACDTNEIELETCDPELVRLAEKGARKMYSMSLDEATKRGRPFLNFDHDNLVSLALVGCNNNDIDWGESLPEITKGFENLFLHNEYEYTSKKSQNECNRQISDFLDLSAKGILKTYKIDIRPLFNNYGAEILAHLLLNCSRDGVLDGAGNAYDVKIITTATLIYKALGIDGRITDKNNKGFKLRVDRYDLMDRDNAVTICTFGSARQAENALMALIDKSLQRHHIPGLTSKELGLRLYHHSGSPFISGFEASAQDINSRGISYQKLRSKELCQEEDADSHTLRYTTWPPELSLLKSILIATVNRQGLGERQVEDLRAFLNIIDNYPKAMPEKWHEYFGLKLYQGEVEYCVSLHHRKIKFYTNGLPTNTYWKIHLYGTGRRDKREGNITEALELMFQAAGAPTTVVS